MIKFKNKNDYINIINASDVRKQIESNKEQKFLKERYKTINYINDKINEAILNNVDGCCISEVEMKHLLLTQDNVINNYALYIHDLLLLLRDKYDYEYSHGNPDRIYLYFNKIKLR